MKKIVGPSTVHGQCPRTPLTRTGRLGTGSRDVIFRPGRRVSSGLRAFWPTRVPDVRDKLGDNAGCRHGGYDAPWARACRDNDDNTTTITRRENNRDARPGVMSTTVWKSKRTTVKCLTVTRREFHVRGRCVRLRWRPFRFLVAAAPLSHTHTHAHTLRFPAIRIARFGIAPSRKRTDEPPQ